MPALTGSGIGEIGQREEVGVTEQAEIGFVDHRPQHGAPFTQELEALKLIQAEIGRWHAEQDHRNRHNHQPQPDRRGRYPAAHEGKAGEEYKLPGKGIEEPFPIRPRLGRQPENIEMCQPVDPGDKGQNQRHMQPRNHHHHRQHGENDHIHRQNIEIVRHIGQRQKAEQLGHRIFKKRIEIEAPDLILLHQLHAVEDDHHGGDDKEQGDMRPVNLPDPLGHPQGAAPQSGTVEHPAKGNGRGHTGAEHENLGRVGIAEPGRNPERPRIARRMGQQDDEHADAAEEIEPRVAGRYGTRCAGRGRARFGFVL